MFGFGRKKEPPKKDDRARRSEEFEERKAQNRAQLGFLVGLDDPGTGGGGVGGSFDVDDADLENELLMLIGDSSGSPSKAKPKSSAPQPSRPRPPPPSNKQPGVGLDFDNEDEDDDGDEIDLDDPELQAELGEILGEDSPSPPVLSPVENAPQPTTVTSPSKTQIQLVPLLQERLAMYEKAKSNADATNDSAKSRRFTRGIKTLKELLVKAQAGRVVDEADIPPAVALGGGGGASTAPPPSSIPPAAVAHAARVSVTPPSVTPVEPFVPLPDYEDSSVSSSSLVPGLPEPLKPTPVAPPVPPRIRPVDSPPRQQPIEPPVDYDSKMDKGPPPPTLSDAESRLKEYKHMAITLKRNKELQEALKYLKLSKVLEGAMATGHPIDITQFPPVPIPQDFVQPEISMPPPVEPVVEMALIPTNPTPVIAPSESATVETSGDTPAAPESSDIFGAPPPPKTIMEALEQRLEKYKSEVEKATSASNSSKARRMGRIVKQYEDAITSHKKGKPVPFDELPTPPGFAPIPGQGGVGSGTVGIPNQVPQTVAGPSDDSTSPEKRIKPSPPQSSSSGGPGVSPGSLINRAGKPVSKLTLQEKQLTLIMGRQKQYRDAAIAAKKRGDINQAREFLRISKGLDNLIEASKSGLPVDLTTVPAPPEDISALEAEDFEVVTEGDCINPGNLSEVYSKLEEDLKQQMKMCMRTRDHFKSIGDVASANRFESMALETKRDLDTLRLAAKKGQGLPKYHYENKVFSITECNTDIKDDEIEINVLRGINLKGTDDLDTYVRVELPYPSAEEAQSQKSHVVKNTTDPEYNVTYKMNVNRTARNFQRFVHRHGVKIEVWSKGGFLRSSTLLGTATAKLQPLESKCVLHDAFDVIDGRKVVGKIEVKIRLREPVLTKQITQKKEKWLSIDRA